MGGMYWDWEGRGGETGGDGGRGGGEWTPCAAAAGGDISLPALLPGESGEGSCS